MGEYEDFIRRKNETIGEAGFEPVDLPGYLYPFQRALVATAVRRGRSALFAECGLGKTGMQLAWAEQVVRHTGGRVLILAPLAVSSQTVGEGEKFGIPVVYRESSTELGDERIVITNYERLGKFDASLFTGVVLDESGILKAYSGTTKRKIIESFKLTPYRLACSATPAPNDIQELGNHSEFLSVLSSSEMIARWFITTFKAGEFRLKGHAVGPFWQWVNSWASMCRKPSDAGEFDDSAFKLPALETHNVVVDVDVTADRGERLFREADLSATKIHEERRRTVSERVEALAQIVEAEPSEAWVIWTDTDYEGDELESRIVGASNLRGSLTTERKEAMLTGFSSGAIRVLIAKPKIAGFGLNWQHCARMAFVASTYSFESYYQAVRRCWRFGQRRTVHCYMVMGSTETQVSAALSRKKQQFEVMHSEMMRVATTRDGTTNNSLKYTVDMRRPSLPAWVQGEAQ